MSSLVRKVSFDKANAKIRALGEVLKRPLREVLDSGARVAAISCAKSSQPYGTGSSAKEAGEKRVAKDIAKVYKTPGRAWKSISNPGQAAGFWKAFKAHEFEQAQNILAKSGSEFSGVPIKPFDHGEAHKAARSKTTGRVTTTHPAMIVAEGGGNGSALNFYIGAVQERVGFGKGGWAAVAKEISGNAARGLKQEGDISAIWITRHAHGFGKVFRSGSDQNPTIRIMSTIPYADHILQGSARTDAIRIARDRMIENLSKAVNAEAKKLK